MNYLLDTSILINATNDPSKINNNIKEILNNSNDKLFVSIISFWEITIKTSIGKLELSMKIDEIASKLILNGVQIVYLDLIHLIELSKLPLYHKDPFDRLLIAQAMVENLTIITSDNKFKYYPIESILN